MATKVQLQTKLASMKYGNTPMADYVTDFETIYNQLAGMGTIAEESMQVATLLESFGDKAHSPYGHIVTSLQGQLETVTWEVATARLLQEYSEKLLVSDGKNTFKRGSDTAVALSAHPKHGSRRLPFKERRRFFKCNEVGHISRDCRKKDGGKTSDGWSSQANHATMLMAVTVKAKPEVLILDSGASDHMVCRAE